ncbi:SCO2523 family variant P-loop protein [Nocardia yamanashiensis]|uniref:SCO2523 family variant P-loop protein n=1 Tax=Nocardia yamanashiensis TaxID=209247 RepID=UPI001E4054C2|nr:SCO2523 family variant P-loop protein [Nocardia yamanashiensis]UGT40574.1 SCO2523 family variant P-loop protein [Nocardia yamanashiensis]
MLVFCASDKGGTGRSVTSCNIAYRLSMSGRRVAYLDFDFGSPTAGAIFEIGRLDHGISDGIGLHGFLSGEIGTTARVSVERETDRVEMAKSRHPGGRLVLFPGDRDGSEFTALDPAKVSRCAGLLSECEQEFDVTLVDLSAGRSIALALALHATTMPQLRSATTRWLVFHRWTRQHIMSTANLVFGSNGILEVSVASGHDPEVMRDSLRFVRVAVPSPDGPEYLRPAQSAWVRTQLEALRRLASRHQMGTSAVLGQTPDDVILRFREQVILDSDVANQIADKETVEAFRYLAQHLLDVAVWESLG